MRASVLLISAGGGEAGQIAFMLRSDRQVTFEVSQTTVVRSVVDLPEDLDYDAIIFDLAAAAGDGKADIQALVAKAVSIPVIALIGDDSEEEGQAAVNAGAQDYLVRSKVTGVSLRRVICYAIERSEFQHKLDRLAQQTLLSQRMEEAWRESQYRIRAITESIFEGVLVTDIDGYVVFSNRSADALLGGEKTARVSGRFIDQVFKVAQAGGAVSFRDGPFQTVMDKGETWRDDNGLFILDGGRSLQVGYACSELRDEETLKGVIISFRDITELKRAQQEALQASKLASVGQLAAGIAHEINTPIQYIGDNLRFLGESFEGIIKVLAAAVKVAENQDDAAPLAAAIREADLDYLLGEIPQAIGQSLEGVGQVARIVLAMKEFSHPVEREKAPVDLNRAIENTLAVSRNEWKHFAEIDSRLDPDLPPVMCLAGALNQVLLNLIVNAAHAIEAKGMAEKGHITIRTGSRGNLVEVSVEDDGIGMSDTVKERIFDPFFTTKAVGRGTGQGLAICRDVVVTKHGGKIGVETREGQGTCFTVTLPIDGAMPAGERT